MDSAGVPTSINKVVKADTGLGTTFERIALNSFLLRLYQDKGLTNVLEGPGDGMTGIAGINSLAIALKGVDVSLVLLDPDRADFARHVWSLYVTENRLKIEICQNGGLPFEENQFDLVWNFNVMTRQVEPQELLKKMCKISRRFVLVFVPNYRNYSFSLHRLHHIMAREVWDHGDINLMRPEAWHQMLRNAGLRWRETVWLDCPWWPDIVDFGQLISDFFPFLKRLSYRAEPQNRYFWPADGLPYYNPERFAQVHQRMARLSYFEHSKLPWLKMRFAHHVGILAEKCI